MPRTGRVPKRTPQPDPIYQNPLVGRLINKIMTEGKKTIAQKIVYEAFKSIESQGHDPVKIFEKALDNIAPKMEVKPRRVGGASYMVPIEVRGSRKQSLALTWLVEAARSRSTADIGEKPKNKPIMIVKLTQEIMEASENGGKAVAKREEMNRMADANKAFAHFRW